MSPRLRIWGACRALAIRSRPIAPRTEPFLNSIPRTRWYSSEGDNQPPKPIDNSNNPEKLQSQVESKEASVPDASAENSKPEVTSSTVNSDAETLDDATLEQLFFGGRTVTSKSEGGLTQAQEDTLYREGMIPSAEEAEAHVAAAEQADLKVDLELEAAEEGEELETVGAKFGLPTRPWPEDYNHKKRYHPVLHQITRLLMRDGKLSVAQRNMATVMNFLRTAPEPIYSPKFPLLPGTPPAVHLPLNPILYLTVAIDSVAPLMKVRHVPGGAGGGRSLEVPVPLAVRPRRRVAFQWILDVVNKKPSKGSGRKQFPIRIAEEIIAVVEGRSGVWEKRKLVHKLGTASRANIGSRSKGKKSVSR
ncbi:ribosomal protein S7 domain-containing protein [Dactylonectria estremocensis]|uniref:Small ribosomal subunit protein uS7m n=1 Tax=Dactylonectria estremocensis TaxID=1079267 RepID=A0A9P9FBR8_9HYPO|nr:ribosomal protein S7 domain-containing protein [Dactylonectria estremocensis]